MIEVEYAVLTGISLGLTTYFLGYFNGPLDILFKGTIAGIVGKYVVDEYIHVRTSVEEMQKKLSADAASVKKTLGIN